MRFKVGDLVKAKDRTTVGNNYCGCIACLALERGEALMVIEAGKYEFRLRTSSGYSAEYSLTQYGGFVLISNNSPEWEV